MNNKICPSCGKAMKRNGRTSAGTQRWRCRGCGSSAVHSYGSDLADFNAFIGWLLSKDSQRSMPGEGRTFRRRSERFWKVWPMPDVVDEVHRVVFVDGIYLDRGLCVLIACTEEHVLSWYLARGETAAAWRALLRTIAPPEVVVADGGSDLPPRRRPNGPPPGCRGAPTMRSARSNGARRPGPGSWRESSCTAWRRISSA